MIQLSPDFASKIGTCFQCVKKSPFDATISAMTTEACFEQSCAYCKFLSTGRKTPKLGVSFSRKPFPFLLEKKKQRRWFFKPCRRSYRKKLEQLEIKYGMFIIYRYPILKSKKSKTFRFRRHPKRNDDTTKSPN